MEIGEIIYEDETSISIWRYNKKKNPNGPYEVEHKWKKSFDPWKTPKKTLGDIVKSEKTQKRKSNSTKTP
jgi:hypothetical protein